MPAASSRIFVTVGFGFQDFSRLIRAVDDLIPSLGVSAVMQIGGGSYQPRNAEFFRTAPSLAPYIRDADLVIAHGGMTAVEVLAEGKPLVIVPRLAKYGEHINDHQTEFVNYLQQSRALSVVNDTANLLDAITAALSAAASFPQQSGQNGMLVQALREYIGNPLRIPILTSPTTN